VSALTHAAWRRRTTGAQWWIWFAWLIGALAFVLSTKVISDNTMWMFVADAPAAGWDMVARMFPPRWHYAERILVPLWDTLNIATLGTAIGTLIAIPVAFLAANNTTPSRAVFRPLALGIIVASRSINSLIWALLLVTVVGPGVLAGIIAIALRSIGFIGKLLYEAIEEVDAKQVEAITATGAGTGQVLGYAVVPQVLPSLVGTAVYRWDINIRESTVLGIVGAGGIGLPLAASIDTLAWPQVTIIFMAILGTVFFAEWLSNTVRRKII